MSLPPIHAEALIAEARAGSKEALGELLEAFYGFLERKARQHMGTDLIVKIGESAVVQDTLLTALIKFAEFQGHTGKQLASWLTRILYHRVESLRKQYHSGKRDVDREIPLTAAIAEGLEAKEGENGEKRELRKKEQRELIAQTYWQLPDPYQQVIWHRYFEGSLFREIAEVMQRSVPAVKKLWSRALRLWKKKTESLERERDLAWSNVRPTSDQEARP
jgi:RNA polymerase sigma-70 factor (subfamily 1)